jgi:hypothetical protein
MIAFTPRWSRLHSRRRTWRVRLAGYEQAQALAFPWRPLALVHRRPRTFAARTADRAEPSPAPTRPVHVTTHVTQERWRILPGTRLERVVSHVQQMDLHVSHRQFLLMRDARRTFSTATVLRLGAAGKAASQPAHRRLATSRATLPPSLAIADRTVLHSEHRVRLSFHRHLAPAVPYGRRDAVDPVRAPGHGSIAPVVVPAAPVVRDLRAGSVARRLATRAASATHAALHDKPAPPFGAGPPPVPMVVRRPPVDSRQAEAAPIAVGSRAGASTAAVAAAAAEPPQLRAAAWPPVPAPERQLNLDGPAIDRLAEDVMSRIDRRLRIERERRGL